MKVYTKKGDEGQTSLIGGTRVAKYHLRIEAYGTVDELNSNLGLLSDQERVGAYIPLIRQIQDRLFSMGSLLAMDPEKSRMDLPGLKQVDIEVLEQSIDEMETHLAPLKSFILPGGHPANSVAHICRCVCRRAERTVVHLAAEAEVAPEILQYLNRLSDWLFVFAREMSHISGAKEIEWHPS
ncbi:MAG TPA: cob(I)yrinic acid a,c-diamide adenosyltransferase [Bacteroidetes bacterium]|nr:cob(I)yrinic acid a,c-diamide adenosyltransferase [Bacteroidota bacterium]